MYVFEVHSMNFQIGSCLDRYWFATIIVSFHKNIFHKKFFNLRTRTCFASIYENWSEKERNSPWNSCSFCPFPFNDSFSFTLFSLVWVHWKYRRDSKWCPTMMMMIHLTSFRFAFLDANSWQSLLLSIACNGYFSLFLSFEADRRRTCHRAQLALIAVKLLIIMVN